MIGLGEVCKDRVFLASTLLKIYRHERQETELLRIMNEQEVQRHSQGCYCTVLYCIGLYCIVLYFIPCLEKYSQRPGLPLHILRYTTGNMQRVVFHSTFPILLARNSLLGSIERTSQKPAPKLFNSYEPLRTFPITSGHFPTISEHFRRFPKIFRKF